jgi:hypothetical protein
MVFVDLRFGINHERKYVYIRMPKAANSSVVASLYASHTGRDPRDWNDVAEAKAGFLAQPGSLSAAGVDALEGYRIVTVVRDPVRRAISAYRNKIAGHRPQARLVQRALGRPAGAEISLEEFVGYLEGGGLMQDPHWMPQRHFIPVGFRMPELVGKVENLAADLPRILAALYPGSGRLADFRPHATGAGSAAVEPALQARLAALYAIDYEAFDYARP